MLQPKRKICVVTGSRADYGLLLPVMREINTHEDLQFQLMVSGAHLSHAFGHTVDVIKRDGFQIDAMVEMPLEDDSPCGIGRALGAGVAGFSEALQRLQPDLLLVLGDRYEILACTQAALIATIPVAHIAGGDLTYGAFDDCIRHAITKMAHLHFVTHEQARRRVLQMGEMPDRVFLVGSPGIDQIRLTSLVSQEELERRLGFRLRDRNLAITFHPPTLSAQAAGEMIKQLLNALDDLGDEVGLIFTGANADPRGREINRQIDEFVQIRENAVSLASLGQQLYYTLVVLSDAVVGNSSSGLYEAPSLGTPTVNIGDRQEGRPKAASVIDCLPESAAIHQAIEQAFEMDVCGVVNPYGDGHAAGRIVEALSQPWCREDLIKKRFRELDFCE